MPLVAGARLGAYEILSAIGAGGMGEVYRARDTKLSRDVALKILPPAFTADPERVGRFRREAQVLASLNHPHIAQIHGLDEINGTQFLVLELVDGETLDTRISRGPMPVDDAVSVARQIAEALEAAHERGIIHRDLKPANIALTKDGRVKVLDFGLAKAIEPATGAIDPMNSPTITSPAMLSRVGVILGTPAYMSPEQAKGIEADARSDVFSFGCVLYEMLTGRQAFTGDSIAEVMAALLTREPDLAALSPDLDPRITGVLRRCVEKNVRRRWHAVADIRLEIEAILAEPAGLLSQTQTTGTTIVERPLWKRAIPAALTFILGTALGGAALWTLNPSPTAAVTRFLFSLPEGQQFTTPGLPILSIAPDGSQFVYVANGQLYLKPMSELSGIVIQGAAIPDGGGAPVFSPDSRSLIFWSSADNTIKRIGVSGGTPVTVGAVASPYGMSWGPDDWILVGQGNHGIVRVSANGGKPETIVRVKPNELAHGPQMLPGGNAVLFTLGAGAGRWDSAQIVAQSLKSGERKVLIDGGSDARYLPTGHLIYALNSTLFAVPFDVKRLAVTGSAVPVVEGVRNSNPGRGESGMAGAGATGTFHVSVSDNGTLIYIPGADAKASPSYVALVDRKGTLEHLRIPPGPYANPRVSPDGKHVAFESNDGKESSIWIYELSGVTPMRRLTLAGNNRFPLWSADGQKIVFQSDREGDLGIFWQRADGAGVPERLTKPEQGESHVPESWSPRGERFSFSVIKGSTVFLSTFSLQDRKASHVEGIQSSLQLNSVFSPDGRWLAYYSVNPGGDRGIFVQPFPPTGAKYQIWDEKHYSPIWSSDGKYLYSHPSMGQFDAVSVTTQPVFAFGSPAVVPMGALAVPATRHRTYDVMPDGKRFIGITAEAAQGTTRTPHIQIVLNWFQELKQRVAAH